MIVQKVCTAQTRDIAEVCFATEPIDGEEFQTWCLDPRDRKNKLEGIKEIRVIATLHNQANITWYEVARIGGNTTVCPEEGVQNLEITTHKNFYKVDQMA